MTPVPLAPVGGDDNNRRTVMRWNDVTCALSWPIDTNLERVCALVGGGGTGG